MNIKELPHGDHDAHCTAPKGTVHRSGVQPFVVHTRKTLPTVEANKRHPSGDQFSRAAGSPIRFNGAFSA